MARSGSPGERYEKEHARLDDLGGPDADAIKELLRALNPEYGKINHTVDGEQDTKALSSLVSYGRALRLLSGETNKPLRETKADEFNDVFDNWDLSAQTIKQRQSALRKFLEYWREDAVADPRDIVLETVDTTSSAIDPSDVLTGDDIEALQDACTNKRDRCLVDLLAYTGQRIRAIQTLRVGDVNPDAGASGQYRLNTDVDGLKGADETAQTRPLLGAQKAVQEWLRAHPTGDDGDFLITALPSATAPGGLTPGEALHRSVIHETLSKIADSAGVERDVNPHAFRHFFVTVCKKQYDLEDSEIKHLIGHSPDSRVMETTYAHLSDEEVAKNIEEKFGFDVERDESALTPPQCHTCNEPLPGSAKACPSCGRVYTPDAQATREEIKTDARDDAVKTVGDASADGDDVMSELAKELTKAADDPEAVRRLVDQLED